MTILSEQANVIDVEAKTVEIAVETAMRSNPGLEAIGDLQARKDRLTSNLATPSFAMADPATFVSGIFRVLDHNGRNERGDDDKKRRKGKLDVEFSFGGDSLRFVCHEPLGGIDQSVLLAILGLGGYCKGIEVSANSTSELRKGLWEELLTDGAVGGQPGIVNNLARNEATFLVSTSKYQLLKTIGLTDGPANYLALSESIFRLAATTIRVKTKTGQEWAMKMLSYSSDPSGNIAIGLNSRFARAFAVGQQNINVSLVERREFSGEVTSLLHCYLSACVRPGNYLRIRVDLLIEKIYPVTTQASDEKASALLRKRRHDIRKALASIGSLKAWRIADEGGVGTQQIYKISRNKTSA